MVSRLISLALGKPKLILIVVAVVAAGGHFAHYKHLQGKVDRLSTEKAAISRALSIASQTVEAKENALRIEREAVAAVMQERDSAHKALSAFRSGRNDQESIEWAAQAVPQAERDRMCEAVPELVGCD